MEMVNCDISVVNKWACVRPWPDLGRYDLFVCSVCTWVRVRIVSVYACCTLCWTQQYNVT